MLRVLTRFMYGMALQVVCLYGCRSGQWNLYWCPPCVFSTIVSTGFHSARKRRFYLNLVHRISWCFWVFTEISPRSRRKSKIKKYRMPSVRVRIFYIWLCIVVPGLLVLRIFKSWFANTVALELSETSSVVQLAQLYKLWSSFLLWRAIADVYVSYLPSSLWK